MAHGFEQLERLTLEQLNTLSVNVAAEIVIREGTAKRRGSSISLLQLWHTAIETALGQRSIGIPPFRTWTRMSVGGERVKPHLPAAELYLQRFFDGTPRRPQLYAARAFVIECLITFLDNSNVPISPGAVCRNMSNYSTAIESQFPNYANCNLLPLIFRQMTGQSS